jgi:hypothetical protein
VNRWLIARGRGHALALRITRAAEHRSGGELSGVREDDPALRRSASCRRRADAIGLPPVRRERRPRCASSPRAISRFASPTSRLLELWGASGARARA